MDMAPVILTLSTVGLLDATWRLLAQVDLKRIIALLTIIETNWLSLCLFSGCQSLVIIGLVLVIVHTFTTTLEFSLVELIYRRFNSRSVLSVSGLGLLFPNLNKLCWLTCLTTIGLPGSSIFTLKLLFLVFFVKVSPTVTLILAVVFLVILPCFIIRVFSCISGGHVRAHPKATLVDLSSSDLLVPLLSFFLSCFIGFVPFTFF